MNWKWLGAALGVGVVIGWCLHRPAVVIEERVVTKEVVKWQTKERIKTLPGATVYITRSPDGTETTRVEGPAEIGRDSEGSASRHTDSNKKMESGWHGQISVGALLPRPAVQVGMDYRIGTLFGAGVGLGVIGEWPWASYVPNRGGVRMILTF